MSDSFNHKKDDAIRLVDVHRQITGLFDTYGCKWITRELSIDQMRQWGWSVEARLRLPHNKLSTCVSEFYWVANDLQFAIGDSLWAHQFCNSPRGAEGMELRESDVPDLVGLGEVYFWHHYNYAYECLYRAWERICAMLVVACRVDTSKRLYFDGLVKRLGDSDDHQVNPRMRSLAGMVKYWTKVAGIRNRLSHNRSSHLEKQDITLRSSSILGTDNLPLICYEYFYPDLLEELGKLRDDNHRIAARVFLSPDLLRREMLPGGVKRTKLVKH